MTLSAGTCMARFPVSGAQDGKQVRYLLSGGKINEAMRRTLLLIAMTVAAMQTASAQDRFDVFPTMSEKDIPYRIPAIAALPDGTVICVADFRHSRNDIGIKKDGRVDLHVRVSPDNGCSWGEIKTLIPGKGAQSPDFMNVAFGDPCIVADDKSGKVLLMSCAGNVSFPKGTREHHQGIARFYSEDGGQTWTAPEDIAESIYEQFDGISPVKAMFIASGRILQSRYVKKGKYHRLYCAVMVNAADNTKRNHVLYSDDFGHTWSVLGGPETAPIPTGADEAKVEELPGGSILISSRTEDEGRLFNIYRFDNRRKATGRWGTMAHSSGHNGGIITEKNACNGGLMLVSVVRTEDGRKMNLLLQSAPIGPGRTNVGIYYKALGSPGDYTTPERIAKDWEGVFRVTSRPSAYSTMVMQADGTLGFLFEEQTHCTDAGGGYTIVYERLSIDEMTGGAYTVSSGR